MDESSDRKRCREDHPEEASPSPGTNTKNKKRRKKKNKGNPEKVAESNQGSEVSPNHQPLGTSIPIVSDHDPLISITVEENGITVENPQLCSKIELAVESGKEKGVGHNEATDKDTPLEKKENNVLKPQGAEPNEAGPQVCSKPEVAIPVVQENNEVAEPPQVNAGNPTVTPKPESTLPVNLELKKEAEPIEPQAEHPKPQPCSEPDPAPSEDPITPIQQSKKKKKNRRERRKIKCSEEKVENQSNPLQCSLNQIQPDSAIPVCPKPASPIDPAISADPAIKVDPALPICPKPVETIIGQTIPVSPAVPIDTERKTVKKEWKGTLAGAESNEHNTEPPETLAAAAPIGPAIPTDPGQEMTKRKRKYKRKNALKSAGEEPNKHDGTPHEIPVRRSMCPIAATPIDPTIPMDQIIPLDPAIKVDHSLSVCPKPVETIIGQAIPVSPAVPIDTEQKTVKKEWKGTLDGAESNEQNTEPPETLVQTAICPIAAAPIGPAIPTDPGQKMTKRKRKYKRKNALKSAEGEPNKHDGTPHETPVQRSMFPIAATPIDPTIPMDQIIPIDLATPIYPEQKMPQKKRKKKKKQKSALKSEGEEPNKHDGKPHEAPVHRSMCPIAATPIDPTIPMDQIIPINPATPIYPEQKMPQKKRKKKKKLKSALKTEGTEPNEHNAKPTVETQLLGIKGPTVSEVPFDLPSETSMRKCNAEPPAKTRVQSTEGLKVTKVPFHRHGESSMICRACQQRGHRFEVCPRLKCLSKDEEICFFCGEIGHSLGKCSVSKAGGGRLAKCLFCYARGHFSNNCPRNGHGIDPKDVAATGPIIKTVESEVKPVAELNHVSRDSMQNCMYSCGHR